MKGKTNGVILKGTCVCACVYTHTLIRLYRACVQGQVLLPSFTKHVGVSYIIFNTHDKGFPQCWPLRYETSVLSMWSNLNMTKERPK